MSDGRVLALDPGSKRIGVAVSDALRIVATPLEVVDLDAFDERLVALLAEYAPTTIVVGMPVGLSGSEGPAAERARAFAERVERISGMDVEWVDERFTTATAEAAMLEGGVKRRERRRTVDKVAAAVILRQYLERRPNHEPDS